MCCTLSVAKIIEALYPTKVVSNIEDVVITSLQAPFVGSGEPCINFDGGGQIIERNVLYIGKLTVNIDVDNYIDIWLTKNGNENFYRQKVWITKFAPYHNSLSVFTWIVGNNDNTFQFIGKKITFTTNL